jgi:hypothetical protein
LSPLARGTKKDAWYTTRAFTALFPRFSLGRDLASKELAALSPLARGRRASCGRGSLTFNSKDETRTTAFMTPERWKRIDQLYGEALNHKTEPREPYCV